MSRSLGVSDSKADIDEGTITGLTRLNTASGASVGFFGVTAITRRSGAAQAQLSPASLVTSLAGYGFYNATIAASLVAQVEEIRAALVAYGLMTGAA